VELDRRSQVLHAGDVGHPNPRQDLFVLSISSGDFPAVKDLVASTVWTEGAT
jgi:hypothetical protein